MKLKQIKEFNSENISEEFAAELCALIGLQSAWKNYEKGNGFTIKDEWYGKSKGSSSHADVWNNPDHSDGDYVRTHNGVDITVNRSPGHRLRIFEDGRGIMYSSHSKGDIKSAYTGDSSRGISPSIEYFDKHETYHEYPCSAFKLMQLYLDNGFYTVEI